MRQTCLNRVSFAEPWKYSSKTTGGGLSLLRYFPLDRSYYTQEERDNAVQVLQILKLSNYPDVGKTLNKVAGLFSHNLQSEWLEIDFFYWGSPERERIYYNGIIVP